MARIIFILLLCLSSFTRLKAQDIVMSFPEKIPAKFTDFEVLGRNNMGILIHRFGEEEHALEIYSDNLRPVAKQLINLREKNAVLEELIPVDDQVLAFYTQVEKGFIYLKAKTISNNLEMAVTPVIIDSLPRNAWQGVRPYYIKSSSDNSKILVFYLLSNKSASLEIRANILDAALNSLTKISMITEGKEEMTLRSIRMNNEGNLIAVIGHESRKAGEGEYFVDDKYTVYNYSFPSNSLYSLTLMEEDYLYKDVVTCVDNVTGNFYLAGCYQHRKEPEDIGLFFQKSAVSEGGFQPLKKLPFTEESVGQTQSYSFKNWYDKAAIIRPQRIIPRSDGGYVLLTESEYQYTRVVRTDPISYSMYGEQTIRYYDQNHYYDITAYSLSPESNLEWQVALPKSQISEGDGGMYSSFALFQSNSLLKFLFNEDITQSGNFMEYNINPRGEVMRVSLLNADKQEISLIPQKAHQLSGNMILIPGESRKSIQLVLIKY